MAETAANPDLFVQFFFFFFLDSSPTQTRVWSDILSWTLFCVLHLSDAKSQPSHPQSVGTNKTVSTYVWESIWPEMFEPWVSVFVMVIFFTFYYDPMFPMYIVVKRILMLLTLNLWYEVSLMALPYRRLLTRNSLTVHPKLWPVSGEGQETFPNRSVVRPGVVICTFSQFPRGPGWYRRSPMLKLQMNRDAVQNLHCKFVFVRLVPVICSSFCPPEKPQRLLIWATSNYVYV